MKLLQTLKTTVALTIVGAWLVISFILWFTVYGREPAGMSNQMVLLLTPVIVAMAASTLLYTGFLERFVQKITDAKTSKDLGIDPQDAGGAPALPGGTKEPLNSGGLPSEPKEESGVEMNQAQVKALIDNAADVICLIDVDAKLLQVNPASVAVWGYRPGELIGKNLKEFLESSDDMKATLDALLMAEKSVDQLHFENRFRKKSGEIVDMLWSAYWSVSDSGLFCVAHNITDRKRAEKLIQESEQRIRGILENLPAGVALINRSGCLEFMNKTACTLTGYAREMDFSEIRAPGMLSFCKEPFFMKQLDPLISNENAPSIECFVTRQTGDRFPAEASVSFITIDGEQSCLVIFLDAKVKYETERTKREFVAMVSHDLRTPLTSISMILSFLGDGQAGELTPRGTELARKSKRECERLMTMIKDLLDLEKMKSGKFSLAKRETDLVEIIKIAVSTLERSHVSQGVQYKINAPEKMLCYCDGARIIQVLVNVLDNATKYSSSGSEVRIEAKEAENEITISVSNKGRPIPEEKIASIFERFEQVDESDSSERKGTGLGLAICKTIVEQHAGKIWVSSSTAKETVFSITLPKGDSNQDQSGKFPTLV